MLRTRIVFLAVFLGIGSLQDYSFSQTSAVTTRETNLLDQFFLIRRPDFIENCAGTPKADGIIVFRSKTPDSTTKIHVITRSGALISVLVTKTLDLDTCQEFEYQGVSYGLLRANAPLGWNSESDALIGLQAATIDSQRVGSVLPLSDTILKSKCLSLIRPAIPDSEHFDVKTQMQFTAPGGNRQFLLVSVERYVEKNRMLAGDQAVYPTGFVFSIENGNPRLLFDENYLSRVFSISDLDNDGMYEVTVYSGGWGEGSYEVRLFDGKVFLKDKRVLYHWMD